ncbi:MAG: J domain-containing protein [Ilumatobacteraceae bacterium]|nr:J domain-containing protein [Ilumatobacteraceae bacterium]
MPPKKNLNHYEVLGARSDANYATLRSAYRKKMRALHPDAQSSQVNPEEISAVSAAWEVLSRSDRRREYDQTLSIGHDVFEVQPERVQVYEPARFPWKLGLLFIVCGSIVVLILSLCSSQQPPGAPDNVLQGGSCVNIDAGGDAFEVNCDKPHMAVVQRLVPFDAVCPMDTELHRDRQGMGNACVRLVNEMMP